MSDAIYLVAFAGLFVAALVVATLLVHGAVMAQGWRARRESRRRNHW